MARQRLFLGQVGLFPQTPITLANPKIGFKEHPTELTKFKKILTENLNLL